MALTSRPCRIRWRRRRTPVHHQPLQVLGGEADAADVLCLAGIQVQASEHEPVVDGVQLRQAVLIQCSERVPLGYVLHGAYGSGPPDLRQLPALFRTELFQPGVQAGYVVPFVGQIGVVH